MGKNKAQGFTLVELLVVMLVLVALSSITLDFTKDFAFQGRYEVTKDRYEKIRSAIIGRPDVLINGQPDISGFVADMGRLPRNIHELIEEDYCLTDRSVTVKSTCVALPGPGVWVDQTVWSDPTSTTLGFGWNGPYLTITNDPTLGNAISDGWGRGASGDSDHDYGWAFCLGDDISTTTDPDTCNTTSLLNQQLVFKSYGKDGLDDFQTAPSESYDADVALEGVTVNFIENNKWTVDLAAGLAVSINSPSIGDQCDSALLTTVLNNDVVTCEVAGGIWEGVCSDITFLNRHLCVLNGHTWTPDNICSSVAVPNTKLGCEVLNSNWAFRSRDVFLRVSYRKINAGTGGATESFNNDSANLLLSLNGAMQSQSFTSFTDSKIPIGGVVTQLIDTVTDKLFSNICVSNNATPLADCATVGGGFSNGMCFESITDVTHPNDISIKIVGYENT
jgi:prepilin-type N-terminal cleavage/methylation domain-containing protein